MARSPLANWILIGLISLVFILLWGGALPEAALAHMVLTGWSPLGMLGCMFLHTNLLHLLGNMVFLWAFGNAICAKVGNRLYPVFFLGLGVLSSATHLIFDGNPAVGASGAINGIVGMYLVFFPQNDITCFYVIFVRVGEFTVSGFWMILLWLGFDIWGASTSEEGIAYAAHLGGFFFGVVVAAVMCWRGWAQPEPYEKNLLQVFGWMPKSAREPAVSAHAPVLPQGSAKAPAPVFLRVACSCGRTLKVPERPGVQRVRCPACQKVMPIPKVGT